MKSTGIFAEVLRYAAAVLSVAAAAGLTRLLSGLGDSGISPQFFAAVLLSAWFGGLGPGLVATVLSGLATGYLIMLPHANSAAMVREDVLRVLVFSVVAVLASSLHAATRRAALEANRARQAAESASAAKSRFLAMVSHELRTPLGPIVMLSEMLADDATLPERLRQDMRSIRRHVGLEIRLIEDLLDLTRISTGKLNLHLELIDPHHPLTAATQVFEPDLKAKGLDLVCDFTPTSAKVMGDAIRLQQIFWNLIRNAIKFSAEGGKIVVQTRIQQGEGSGFRVQPVFDPEAQTRRAVSAAELGSGEKVNDAQRDTGVPPVQGASEVGKPGLPEAPHIQRGQDARVMGIGTASVGSAFADARDARSSSSASAQADPTHSPRDNIQHSTLSTQHSPQSSLFISVTDTGIGIDPRRLSAIFEAFEQAERDTAAQFGGLGLGLAICKALVEAHGGSIRAYSAGAGRGATFTVALPLAPESGTAWDAGGSSRASRTSHAEALEAPGSDAVSTEVGR